MNEATLPHFCNHPMSRSQTRNKVISTTTSMPRSNRSGRIDPPRSDVTISFVSRDNALAALARIPLL